MAVTYMKTCLHCIVDDKTFNKELLSFKYNTENEGSAPALDR